ncbi:uncharacterized protein LOC134219365 [Armigeres subalbatus]|uniref:uncharacterized protein LOC134219365 n=1 Tax=Armigeres subalbatus TaxID=124917 RepID=UPI002ED06B9A
MRKSGLQKAVLIATNSNLRLYAPEISIGVGQIDGMRICEYARRTAIMLSSQQFLVPLDDKTMTTIPASCLLMDTMADTPKKPVAKIATPAAAGSKSVKSSNPRKLFWRVLNSQMENESPRRQGCFGLPEEELWSPMGKGRLYRIQA